MSENWRTRIFEYLQNSAATPCLSLNSTSWHVLCWWLQEYIFQWVLLSFMKAHLGKLGSLWKCLFDIIQIIDPILQWGLLISHACLESSACPDFQASAPPPTRTPWWPSAEPGWWPSRWRCWPRWWWRWYSFCVRHYVAADKVTISRPLIVSWNFTEAIYQLMVNFEEMRLILVL